MDPFTPSPRLTEIIAACFSQAFKFEYTEGRVGNIFAPEDCPVLCINLVRGILNMLQLTIKKSQNVYELQEVCSFHSDFTLILILLFYIKSSVHALAIFFDLFIAVSSGKFIVFHQYSQAGIEGICQTRYVIQDYGKNKRATISKSKDLTDCQEQAVKNVGMAYIRPCPTCPLVRVERNVLPRSGTSHCQTLLHRADASREFGSPALK